MSVIDLADNKVVNTIAVSGKPAGVAVSPNGDKVYISTPEAHGFAVIDARKQQLITTVKTSEGALGITVAPDGKRIYVADWFINTVSVLDADNLEIIKTITVGQSPSGLVVSPDNHWLPHRLLISVINWQTACLLLISLTIKWSIPLL